jgi:class 3 adenylate cyclase
MEQKDYRLAAIMFTDIHGFSRMMEKDEAGTLKLLSYHNDLIAGIVKRHNGTVIKTIGDALLVDFKNTVDALQSALEIQDELYAYNKAHPELPLLIRIGLHLGDIYFYENDALGEGINIASRLQSVAHPGCICMSQDVYNHVLNKIDFTAEKLGRVSLKNISKEIHAYEIVTPNVEFDPNRDMPKPGYKPGSYANGDAGQEGPGGAGAAAKLPEAAQAAAPQAAQAGGAAAQATQAPPKVQPEFAREKIGDARQREEGSSVLDTIRRSILEDIKSAGRRLSVSEAREKYGVYGPEAEEVIASLAMKGILTRDPPKASRPSEVSTESIIIGNKVINIPTAVPDSVITAVSDIERRIEDAFAKGFDRQSRRDMRREWREQSMDERHLARKFAKEGIERLDPETLERAKAELMGKEGRAAKASSGAGAPYAAFDAFKQRTIAGARKAVAGFRGHFITYAAVIGFLAYLNFSTGGSYPWFLFPLGGWGIGLVQHLVGARRAKANAAEVEKMPKLSNEQLGIYRKLLKLKDGFALHRSSVFAVSTFLAMIFAITSAGGFFWAGIPIAALFFSLFTHRAGYGIKKRGLEEDLMRSLGVEGSFRGMLAGKRKASAEGQAQANEPQVQGEYEELYAQALRTKAAIVDQIKSSGKKNSPIGRDMIPALDEYVNTIKLLASHTTEIDRIIVTIPMDGLKTDKEKLKAKLLENPNERMRREYEKSIEEIEQQEKSFKELEDQREMLGLRIKSSVNALKQMQIDIARLKTMPEANEDAAVTMVKQKTFELFQYLEDLKAGYLDIDATDPYADLQSQATGAAAKKAEEARLLEQKANELLLMSGEVKARLQADGYYQPVEGQPGIDTALLAAEPPKEKVPEGQSQAGS